MDTSSETTGKVGLNKNRGHSDLFALGLPYWTLKEVTCEWTALHGLPTGPAPPSATPPATQSCLGNLQQRGAAIKTFKALLLLLKVLLGSFYLHCILVHTVRGQSFLVNSDDQTRLKSLLNFSASDSTHGVAIFIIISKE